MNNTAEFSKILGHEFKNQDLLMEALTHKSYSIDQNRNVLNNERLEFLGDSILNFVVAERLLNKFVNEQEGVLSKKRAALVNLNKLAEIAKKFKLESFMRFGPGEVKQGNHLNPRIQGSCVESLIGAIYLDSNFENAKKWVLSQFADKDFDIEVDASFESDYKSRLQEYTQQRKLGTPQYQLVLMSGPSHKPNFLVALFLNEQEKVRAEGASKKIAEQKAAEMLLKELLKEKL